eukprot:10548295-Lingulodinium_polyedra.AAC.1
MAARSASMDLIVLTFFSAAVEELAAAPVTLRFFAPAEALASKAVCHLWSRACCSGCSKYWNE